ncbi:hypothetical protein NEOLEDRAFT_1157737 [Neolentinus lepideus HHB14362 ss-1]|uniref:Aspartic peptidase DDI1-type domain-containing protein n=1 Tax=Neolentinus lepideus HHB14362 ss-1 TaxID=1314782 RepID=A0A165QID6_9AGAM|nr:hypothetical protein NEOLEDRAFT_1157737 [Neolentinus lepideus HHB14362 ss-1]
MLLDSGFALEEWNDCYTITELNGVQVPPNTFPSLERNASTAKDFKRIIPKPLVVVVQIDGRPARALIDSGSLADFMSLDLANQLRLNKIELAKPLAVQLAVQGSRSKVNWGATAQIKYQSIDCKRYFDLMNLQNYDVILGTPFIFQHNIMLGLNPPKVIVGHPNPMPIRGEGVQVLASRAAEVLEEDLDRVRKELIEYARPIFLDGREVPLPPLRAVNHAIPLKDDSKVYHWRPSKCPDPQRQNWIEKRDSYLRSGRWKPTLSRNACPMLLLTKPGTGVRGRRNATARFSIRRTPTNKFV